MELEVNVVDIELDVVVVGKVEHALVLDDMNSMTLTLTNSLLMSKVTISSKLILRL